MELANFTRQGIKSSQNNDGSFGKKISQFLLRANDGKNQPI